MTKSEIEAVKLLRSYLPNITVKMGIRWWEFWLWKYRKQKFKALGLRDSIEVVLKIKEILKNE